MVASQQRVDNENNNTNARQNISRLVYDAARNKIYLAWAAATVSPFTHNRKIMFQSFDASSGAPDTIITVEAALTSQDFESGGLDLVLMSDGTLLCGYGSNGVRVKESTDGGTTWATSTDADETFGLSTRRLCGFIHDGDDYAGTGATIVDLITQESGGGGTFDDVYQKRRTGAGTWGTQTKIHNSGSGSSPIFRFLVPASSGPRIGRIVDANVAFLVGNYSNASNQFDQVRALYTTNAWAAQADVLIHDYTGTSLDRGPIVVMGADGTARVMWINSSGGDPVFATSTDGGATWTEIGAPSPLAAEPWGVAADRFFALDGDSILYAGAFETPDMHHIWTGEDSLVGWVDNPVTGLANIGDSAGAGDGLIVGTSLWRAYTRINSGRYELWLLTVTGVIAEVVIPPEADAVARGHYILATITLPEYDVNPEKVLHLSNRPYVDTDGLRWDPLIVQSPAIDHGGGYVQSDVQIVDGIIGFLDKPITGMAESGEKLSDLLVLYRWEGARCHIQEGFIGSEELHTLLDGEIAELADRSATRLSFQVTQDRKFDVVTPPRTVNALDDPLAPKDLYGQRKQIAIGDWSALREKDSTFNGYGHLWGITRGAAPLIPIASETSTGDAFPTLLASDKQLQSEMGASYIFEDTINQYAKTYTPPDEDNAAGGPATTKLADRFFVTCILPIEVHPDTTADGGQECIREDKPRDLSGYATLDYDAGKRVLKLRLPDLQPLGTIEEMEVSIAYSKNASSGTPPYFGYDLSADAYLPFGADIQYQTFGSGAAGSPPDDVPAAVAVMVVNAAKWNDWLQFKNAALKVVVADAGQVINVHRIVVNPRYKATAKLIKPGKIGSFADIIRGRTEKGTFRLPGVTSFEARQFGFPLGVPDKNHASGSADGFYTGSAGTTLIEHPCDVVKWILRELGGVAEDELTAGLTTFGGFAGAKAALSGYKIFGLIDDGRKVSELIREISEQTLCWFMRTPTEPLNPWIAVPWDVGATVDYRTAGNPFTFKRKANHVSQDSFRPVRTNVAEVRNVVRLNYDYDPRTGTYADQLFITGDDSRVYSGGSFTTDGTREAIAAESILRGAKEKVINARWIKDPATASSVLTRYFDLRALPKPRVRFTTYANAYDLNRGHVIQFDGDWDSIYRFPREGSDGSWEGKALRIVTLKRLKGSVVRYAAEAVEI